MLEIRLIPFYLEIPEHVLSFKRSELFPGVHLEILSQKNIAELKSMFESYHWHPEHPMNIRIRIGTQKYESHLIQKLRSPEIGLSPKYLETLEDHREHLTLFYSNSVHRHILLSIYLLTRPVVAVTPHQLILRTDEGKRLLPVGFIPSHLTEKSSQRLRYQDSDRKYKKISSNEIKKMATLIEPYFNPGHRRHDRLSLALGHYWVFLFSPYSEAAFTSLMSVFEALLVTGKSEVTHQVSERAALTIGQNLQDRYSIYKEIKRLYNLRSTIVHGRSKPGKGRINAETSWVAATHSNVSITQYTRLSILASSLIRNIIRNREYMDIIQGDDNENRIDDHFASLIFR